ncbi:ATP-NAD kinase family protein [Haloglomus salinum]|jgi:predicted polyphosphate/ATP-dependent NAD kinase|uniref:ATP-NAD kinase family protein n=1 Tax=Haloglomus salinum TaxID=2962673 RepID=UPI0020C98D91|nr:ATP-NAD kinase family protein [Haloglomus salinum]
MTRRVGVVVNPIAGMGGRVGLKGTDNKVEEARRRGAEPRASDRATEALEHLRRQGVDLELVVWGGRMGEEPALDAGFDPSELTVAGQPADPEETGAEDTRAATRAFVTGGASGDASDGDDAGVDLVLFVGGDGTAVDVAETLDELDSDTPMLGVPAGVKVYSSVFAVTPRAAGRLAATFDRVETREVNDIDEDAYRGGDVRTDLKALANVPVGEELQSSKQIGGGSVEALAQAVAAEIRDDEGTTYVLGPGSTVDAIKTELGFDGSPLGVDVWRDGEVLVRDAGESDILENLGEENVIVVSPIGGQGFVFGRGNPQISPPVIRQCEVTVVASSRKLDETGVLRVDTGDTDLDEELRGWQRVRVGKFERRLMEVV